VLLAFLAVKLVRRRRLVLVLGTLAPEPFQHANQALVKELVPGSV